MEDEEEEILNDFISQKWGGWFSKDDSYLYLSLSYLLG